MTDREMMKFTYTLVEKLEDKVFKLEEEVKDLKNGKGFLKNLNSLIRINKK